MKTKQQQLLHDTFITAALITSLSVIALLLNHYCFHFSANNYFPQHYLAVTLMLLTIHLGNYLAWKDSRITASTHELLFYYFILSVIALATNAVQLTPFAPIDAYLIRFDNFLHIDNVSMLTWLKTHPRLLDFFIIIYDTLPKQLILIPIIMIFLQEKLKLREFYLFLLLSTLIGFLIYYFFPTIGPATAYNNPIFGTGQFATGLKFAQIHQGLPPSTMDGGLIALPSFHVIWAWACLYLTRNIKYLYYPLLFLNTLLVIACVVLGWHYLIDIFASIIVIAACHYLMRRY